MRLLYYMFIVVMLLSVLSCGQQHKAESVVKGFMERNMLDGKKPSNIVFHDIDSTTYITDSLVYIMRNVLKQSDRYSHDITYSSTNMDGYLKIIRVEYKLDGQKYSDSYYLDNKITGVVSLKCN